MDDGRGGSGVCLALDGGEMHMEVSLVDLQTSSCYYYSMKKHYVTKKPGFLRMPSICLLNSLQVLNRFSFMVAPNL